MTFMPSMRSVAVLATLLCGATVGKAQLSINRDRPAVPWTTVVPLDPSGSDQGWTVVIASPPPDAVRPAGGFPILYYLDDETSLLLTDTARRLGGSRRNVILAGLRPGPRAFQDRASRISALRQAAAVVTRMHPGEDRCSVLFDADSVRTSGMAPAADEALPVTAYATFIILPGQSDWAIRFTQTADRARAPQPKSGVGRDEAGDVVKLHSDDRLLALPEGSVRAIEWTASCKRG